MTKTLNVGIAGYGVVGKRRREYIDQHLDLQTVAVCDKTFAADGQFDDGVLYFTDYKKLLTQELDVLFVCLTNDIAAEVTIAGLTHQLHVFCEKPPGRNVTDVQRVIDCEKQYPHLKLKYGFNHRYHESVEEALRIVRSKELGEIINLRGVYGKSRMITYGQHSDWRTRRAIAGGGILLDQGIHMVDLLRLFAGDFTEIYSFISNDFWRHEVEDNAYALLRTDEGKVAMLHSSATQWRHRFRLEISLEKGTVILGGILSGSKSYGAETLTVSWATDDGVGDPKEQLIRYNEDPSWRNEIQDFANAILNDIPIRRGTSEDAFKTMQLVYQIYCADQQWRDQWDLSAEPASADQTLEGVS